MEAIKNITAAEALQIVRVEIVRDFDKSYYANLYDSEGEAHNLSKEYTDFRTLKKLCKEEYGVSLPNLSEVEFEEHGRKSYAYISTETPLQSTQAAETVNVSEEPQSEPREAENEVQTLADMVAIGESLNKGESVSFMLHLHFLWSATITNESAEWCEGFKWSLKAKCLDNPQSFSRRYTSFGLAMLHCLNQFNENANIRDDYETLSAALNKPQNLISDFIVTTVARNSASGTIIT